MRDETDRPWETNEIPMIEDFAIAQEGSREAQRESDVSFLRE
jgi:hypothetical protein